MSAPSRPQLNHVAFLVRDVKNLAAGWQEQGFPVGALEDFPGEGTREAYVGPPGFTGRLLLLQAIGPGPYARALEKRGPGLHHLGIDTLDLEGYLARLEAGGWSRHPVTEQSLARHRTAYLYCREVPTLLEVHARDPISTPSHFIHKVEIPTTLLAPLQAIELGELHPSPNEHAWITCQRKRLRPV
ncbi:MAG: hypothetical protein AB7P04_11935 [Bacteriovoracia bacterium]